MVCRIQCGEGATIPTGAWTIVAAMAVMVAVIAVTACDQSRPGPTAIISPAPDPATVSKLGAATPIGPDVPSSITVMAVSADGTHLAAATVNHTVIVWRFESPTQCVRVGEFPAEPPISAVALSPNGDRVMAVSAGRARIFTTAPASATPATLDHSAPIGTGIFLGGSDHLLTASGETLVRWSMQPDARQPFLPHRMADEDTPIVAVTASANGRFVLFATPVDADRTAVCLIAFDDNFVAPRMREYHLLVAPSNAPAALAFSADGQTAIAARGPEWLSFDLTAENPSMAVRRFSLPAPETAGPTPRAFQFVIPFAQRFYVAVDGATVWRLDPTAESAPATAIGTLPVPPQPTQSLAGIGIAGQGRWLVALIDGELHCTTIE